jgi:hypothetical protein
MERVHELRVTDAKWDEIVAAAQEGGFDSPQAYLVALHDRALAGADDLEADSDEAIIAGIREGLLDIKAGRTYPADAIWRLDELDLDDD